MSQARQEYNLTEAGSVSKIASPFKLIPYSKCGDNPCNPEQMNDPLYKALQKAGIKENVIRFIFVNYIQWSIPYWTKEKVRDHWQIPITQRMIGLIKNAYAQIHQ